MVVGIRELEKNIFIVFFAGFFYLFIAFFNSIIYN